MGDSIYKIYKSTKNLSSKLEIKKQLLREQGDNIYAKAVEYENKLSDEAHITFYTSSIHLADQLFNSLNEGKDYIFVINLATSKVEQEVEKEIWERLSKEYELHILENNGHCTIAIKIDEDIIKKIIKAIDTIIGKM